MNKLRYYSGFAMVVIYLALGLLFLFTDIAVDTFPSYRKPIGIVLLVYAAIRTLLQYNKYKRERNEHEN